MTIWQRLHTYWLKIRSWLIIPLLLSIYLPTFIWMKERFLAPWSNYSHGFLIPIVSGFLIFRMRDELLKMSILPSKKGLKLFIAGLVLHLLGQGFRVDFISGYSLILALFGLSLFFFGPLITKRLIFPIGFLFFMVPLPETLTIFLTFHMKIFATAWASWTANLLGIPAIAQGSRVVLPNDFLEIGAPCSGLRSLISLLALGAVFAYLLPISLPGRLIVFLSSVPLALLSNMVRIVFLIIVTYIYGQEASLTEPTHTLSGLIVFFIAFIGLGILGRFMVKRSASPPQAVEVKETLKPTIQPAYGLVVSLLSISLVLTILLLCPASPQLEARLQHLPVIIGNWVGEDIPLDKQAREMLYDSDLLLRVYRNSSGEKVMLFVVTSKINREAFHMPELCYGGSGAQSLEKKIVAIKIGQREIKVNRLYLKQANISQLVCYWFSAGQVSTPNFYLQQLMFILNQAMRSKSPASLIRVSTMVIEDNRQRAFNLEKSFINDVLPLLEGYTQ